jgi:SP family arabinose:H+ symporter-like MFS transporter
MHARGSFSYLLLICLIAGLGGLLFGFDTAVISGAEGPVARLFHLSDMMIGWIVASALVGCLVGASVAGMLADRFGRKPILLLAAVLFVACSVGSALPTAPWHLSAARIVGGMGIGIASMLAPLYIAEISPARLRGGLVSTYQLAIVLGVLAAFLSNYELAALAKNHPGLYRGAWLRQVFVDQVWRGMLFAGVLPAGLLLVLLLAVPESPRWLTKQGQRGRALEILARINGPEQAAREMSEITAGLALETGSIGELFKPGIRPALWIGIFLPFLSQICGINVIIYYGPRVLEQAAVSRDAALLCQVLFGVVNVAATLAATLTVDRLGRKTLLAAGIAGVGLTLLLAGLMFAVAAPPLALFLVFAAFLACFNCSYGPVCWIVMSEIFPTAIRGRAMSVSVFSLWAGCNLVALTFPSVLRAYGPARSFWLYALTAPAALLYVLTRVPETKGKTLEEIEHRWLKA